MSKALAIIFMGVSGSGKTTAAQAFASELQCPFAEADEFHSEANIAKMSAGIPLQDEDRWPWLRSIRDWMTDHGKEGKDVVLTCSALKRSYRDLLEQAEMDVHFVLLDVDRDVLMTRLQSRTDHYMPASLLDSQLDTLEALSPDEPGITIKAEIPTEEILQCVQEYLDTYSVRRR